MDNHPNQQNQEIDLVYIYRALGRFLTNIGLFFYDFLLFVKKYILVIALLMGIGIGLGYYLDSKQGRILRHDFIVVPNFGSADYLYEAFDKNSFITTKLDTREWMNLKEVRRIKIEPIEDIYTLLKNNKQAMELFETLGEKGGDISSFIANKSTIKNYKYHLLSIYTSGKQNTDSIVEEVFEQLNSQDYYLKKLAIAKVQNQIRKRETELSLQQMNQILIGLGNSEIGSFDSKSVSIKQFPEIENLFYRKNNIMDDLVMIDEEILEQQQVVYIAGKMMNNIDENFWEMKKITMPFLFLLVFSFVMILRNFIRKFKVIKENRQL